MDNLESLVFDAEKEIAPIFNKIDEITFYNSKKVLKSFMVVNVIL